MRLPEVASKAPAQMQEDAQRSSAALGYLTLQLQLFASILDAPLLHESHFLGLHSSVWQPRSFWHAKGDRAQKLLLSTLPTDALSSSFMAGPTSWTATLDSTDQNRYDFYHIVFSSMQLCWLVWCHAQTVVMAINFPGV